MRPSAAPEQAAAAGGPYPRDLNCHAGRRGGQYAVILSEIALLATGIRYFDLAVGAAIGIYVAKEALEMSSEARKARSANDLRHRAPAARFRAPC
jgi:hypothetical protein